MQYTLHSRAAGIGQDVADSYATKMSLSPCYHLCVEYSTVSTYTWTCHGWTATNLRSELAYSSCIYTPRTLPPVAFAGRPRATIAPPTSQTLTKPTTVSVVGWVRLSVASGHELRRRDHLAPCRRRVEALYYVLQRPATAAQPVRFIITVARNMGRVR